MKKLSSGKIVLGIRGQAITSSNMISRMGKEREKEIDFISLPRLNINIFVIPSHLNISIFASG